MSDETNCTTDLLPEKERLRRFDYGLQLQAAVAIELDRLGCTPVDLHLGHCTWSVAFIFAGQAADKLIEFGLLAGLPALRSCPATPHFGKTPHLCGVFVNRKHLRPLLEFLKAQPVEAASIV